jgi:uncharacterized protein YndB with AHSA1/START domain
MRIEETFTVARPPEAVFDYLTDPSKVAEWQTAKTSVETLTDGPPRLGSRMRERTRQPGGKEFEQIVEFTEFERPRHVHTRTSSRARTPSTVRGRSRPMAPARGSSSWPRGS